MSTEGSPAEGEEGLESAPPPLWPKPLQVALLTWGLAIGGLMVARYLVGPVVPWVANNLKAVAVLSFLYLPIALMGRKGERSSDYGLRFDRWPRDLIWALGTVLVVFPPFLLIYWAFGQLLPSLPSALAEALAPYQGQAIFSFRLPPNLLMLAATHLLVVALPEELFYRGFLHKRLEEAFQASSATFRLWGVRIGPELWLGAALFALGHLTEPYPWRLATFFPALLFIFLRLRTGTLLAPIIVHALSNIFMAILEASFYP